MGAGKCGMKEDNECDMDAVSKEHIREERETTFIWKKNHFQECEPACPA